MTIIVHFTIEHQVYYDRKFKEQHAKIWENIAGAKRYSHPPPVISALRGRALPSPPPFRCLCKLHWHSNKYTTDVSIVFGFYNKLWIKTYKSETLRRKRVKNGMLSVNFPGLQSSNNHHSLSYDMILSPLASNSQEYLSYAVCVRLKSEPPSFITSTNIKQLQCIKEDMKSLGLTWKEAWIRNNSTAIFVVFQ